MEDLHPQREPELLTHRDELPDSGDVVHASQDIPADDNEEQDDPATLKQKRWRRIRRTVYVLAGLFIVLPVLAFFIAYQFVSVPSPEEVSASLGQPVTYYFGNNEVMYQDIGAKGNRQILTYDQIPDPVKHAVYAAEDATFETNAGFDIKGILGAAWHQATGGSGGGSTITQQYIKQATGNDQHSYLRKALELVKAYKMNRQQSKPDIITAYLNIVYFGRGAYGIGAAAKAYFNTDVAQLSPEQSAYLAGLIQGPGRSENQAYVSRRWNYVMDRMVEHNWYSAAERQSATMPAVIPYDSNKTDYLDGKDYLRFVKQRVDDELEANHLDADQLRRNGAKIYLSIDPTAEQQAADSARKILDKDHESGADYQDLAGTLVSADPRTGQITAYYGGDWAQSQQDLAGVIAHQVGSAFKPIDFASAMQNDPSIGIGTTYDGTDEQSFPGSPQPVHNADAEDCGDKCSVMLAMTKSVNTVFYNMVAGPSSKDPTGKKGIGSGKVQSTAFQMGMPKTVYNPVCKSLPALTATSNCKPTNVGGGIAIGQYEMTPLGMTQAYATLANNGSYLKLHFVTKVTDNSGENVLYQSADQAKPVLDPNDANHSAQIARNVTQSMLDVASFSGTPLNRSRPVAAKTGTAQSPKDGSHNANAWMIGYTPSAVTAVWVGSYQNDGRPIYGNYRNGKGKSHHYDIYGREEPAYIWQDFMNNYLQAQPVEQFPLFQPLGNANVTDYTGPANPNAAAVIAATSSTETTSNDSSSSIPVSPEPTSNQYPPTESIRPTSRYHPAPNFPIGGGDLGGGDGF